MSTGVYTSPILCRKRLVASDFDCATNRKEEIRWIVLTIMCFTNFGVAYCYDNPAALQNQLMSKYDLTSIEYNLFYSAYTIPNVILPFFSGVLCDIFGVDIITLILFIIIVIGQSVFIFSCKTDISSYPLMFIGRFIFGIGSESFYLVTTPLVYEYFKRKELSFSLGLLLSVGRVGSSLNDYCTYYIYTKFNNNIIIALFAGLILLILCLILLILLLFYRFYQRKQSAIKALIGVSNNNNNYDTFENIKNNNHQNFRISDLKQFDMTFLFVVLNCGFIYGSTIPFMNIGGGFLQNKYSYNHKIANTLLMIPYGLSAVLTPFFGHFTDKFGYRGYILLISTLTLIISHSIFGWYYSDNNAAILSLVIIALSCLGIAYSIFCAIIFPSFAIIVPSEKLLGTAYGIGYSFYNTILSLFAIFVGALTTNKYGIANKYNNVEIFMLSVSVFSTFCVVALIIFDRQSGSKLNKPFLSK